MAPATLSFDVRSQAKNASTGESVCGSPRSSPTTVCSVLKRAAIADPMSPLLPVTTTTGLACCIEMSSPHDQEREGNARRLPGRSNEKGEGPRT
jgi:hypothetical protein